MTGFGRAACTVEGESFVVEIRSVNHRYGEVQLRLPRPLARLEPELRARLKRRFARGKIDVSVSQAAPRASSGRVSVDVEAAGRYLSAGEELESLHGIGGKLDVATLLSLPGVARLVDPELPEEELCAAVSAAVDEASSGVERMRAAEGEALERELVARCDRVVELAKGLEGRAQEVQQAVRERLRKRLEQLGKETGLGDPARLYQELTLAAERLDISEEIVRLLSHGDQFRALLDARGEPVGRRLDFLLQEMAREANTIGSKGGDASIAHQVVDLKGEIERLREQVQNVE